MSSLVILSAEQESSFSVNHASFPGSSVNSAIYSESSISIGSADATKRVFVGVATGSAVTPTSVNLNGNNMTLINSTPSGRPAFWYLDTPTDTAINLLVTYPVTVVNCQMYVVYTTGGEKEITDHLIQARTTPSTSALDGAIDVGTGGAILLLSGWLGVESGESSYSGVTRIGGNFLDTMYSFEYGRSTGLSAESNRVISITPPESAAGGWAAVSIR